MSRLSGIIPGPFKSLFAAFGREGEGWRGLVCSQLANDALASRCAQASCKEVLALRTGACRPCEPRFDRLVNSPGVSFQSLVAFSPFIFHSTVPVIIVTARGQDQDKVRGLDLGADDYLTKPFSVEELLARVRAVLRRTHLRADDTFAGRSSRLTLGPISIDFAQHLVTKAGQEVTLTPTEYRLLTYLAQNIGRVVTQDRLLEQVWGVDYVGESHMLQVNINRLRRKIEADPTRPEYLKTKVGIGYLLVVPPTDSRSSQVND